jgi:hypothetical protein
MIHPRTRLLISLATLGQIFSVLIVPAKPASAQDQDKTAAVEQRLTQEEMRQFLLNAKIISGRQTSKGITSPYRLTLSDGTLTHDAGFQSIDETRTTYKLSTGATEINFRDTYKFNIAAYELAKLLGLERMMPVTVERKYEGKSGSLTWWLKVKMDESDRVLKKISVPDPDAWNNQMHRVRVFSQLVYDTDRNLTNILIDDSWELYMIDFSRAFRLFEDLQKPKDLVRCDRQLFEKLRRLDQAEVESKTKPYLKDLEIKALMKRRDKIVAHFEKLVAEKGESAVLY